MCNSSRLTFFLTVCYGSFHLKLYPELKVFTKTSQLIEISSVILTILLCMSVEFGLAHYISMHRKPWKYFMWVYSFTEVCLTLTLDLKLPVDNHVY